MRRFLALFACFIFMIVPSYAKETKEINLVDDIQLQKQISSIGFKLLNANQLDSRMIFVHKNKESKIKLEPTLVKRQIFVYDKNINFFENEDEIAAYLAREICKGVESYSGGFRGFVRSFQIKAAPKKYERFFDKRAVDYMVQAGYNPLGMITYLNKSQPQRRYELISRHNLTSKRLANTYEYIFVKYPYYLKYNEYIENEAYQNFLLTSRENRKKLYEKIKAGSTKAIKYE